MTGIHWIDKRHYYVPFILFIWSLIAIAPLQASSESAFKVYLLQTSDDIRFEEIRHLPSDQWQQRSITALNFGFTQEVVWLKLPLMQLPHDQRDDKWLLELAYPLLNSIDFYRLQNNQLIKHLHTGSQVPFKQRYFPTPAFLFPIHYPVDSDWIYLRVSSKSSLQLSMRLQPEGDFWQHYLVRVAFSAAFHAIMLAMLLYHFLIFVFTRDRIFLLYSISICAIIMMMGTLHGWTFMLLWPNEPQWNSHALLVSITSTIVFTIYFSLHFLRLKQLSLVFYRLYLGMLQLAAVCSIGIFFFSYALMIQVLAAVAILICVLALIGGAALWQLTRSRDVALFFTAISILLMAFIVYALQKFGLISTNTLSEHAIELGAIFLIILLAVSMAERHNRERQARVAAQDIMIRMQRNANVELDQKVRDRTQELERLNRQLKTESTTDALTDISNRRAFDQYFEHLFHSTRRQHKRMVLMLIDIDHFKPFNDNYGHQVGDHVLFNVAQQLSQCVQRQQDRVFRYGGEEFAVLLFDTDVPGALLLAEKMRHRIEQARFEQSLHVTISIGVAIVIPSNQDMSAIYEKADCALYQAKEAGRNCVRYYDFSIESAVPIVDNDKAADT